MLDLNYKPTPLGETANLSNDEWLKWREHGPHYADPMDPEFIPVTIGGSSCAVLFGASPWKSRLELYHEKSGTGEAKYKRPMNQEILDAGHDFEDAVGQTFLRKMKKDYGITDFELWNDTVMYQHPLHKCMVANLDRRLRRKGQEAILEIKTTGNLQDIKLWKDGIVPKKYEWQCRFYMSVMNINYCYICCCWGFGLDSCAVVLIERDLDIEETMLDEIEDFVAKCEMGIEPEPQTEHLQVLADYYSRFYGEASTNDHDVIELVKTPEMENLFETAKNLEEKKFRYQEQIAGIEEQEAGIAAKVLEITKGTSVFVNMRVDDDTVWSLKVKQPVKRDSFDEEAFKKDYPALYDQYIKEKFDLTAFKKTAENKRIAAKYKIKGSIDPEKHTVFEAFLERKIPVAQ